MSYREKNDISKPYKQKYLDGIERIILHRQKGAEKIRQEYFKDAFTNQDKYRKDLAKMLGWPLVGYEAKELPKVELVKLGEEDMHEIYRMSFDILDGLVMTGLFYKFKGIGKFPLSVVQHGGQGTPEHIAGFDGDTSNYNDMLERVVRLGIHGFAPQLLLWNKERYELDYDRHGIDARLKRVGSSITAIEIFGIKRILDYFEEQDYVSSFGMVGLSYGGFYTLVTSALDTRIRTAVSCAFFNTRDKYGWSDWVWQNSAEKFDDAEIACLVYPRKLRIAVADKDPLFNVVGGIESFENVKNLCEGVGTDWVEFTVFDGVHEFLKDDRAIEQFVKELKDEKF